MHGMHGLQRSFLTFQTRCIKVSHNWLLRAFTALWAGTYDCGFYGSSNASLGIKVYQRHVYRPRLLQLSRASLARVFLKGLQEIV